MKSLWHISPDQSELKKGNASRGYKSVCSMISTGTERLVARGLVGKQFESHMSVPHMKGGFEFPIKYGYSLIVEDDQGRLGHIMHPHQDVINAQSEDIYWIDEEIPAARFTLISNMETIINAIWDSNPKKNDKIAICGFGNIGSLLANTLQVHFGITPQIIEKDKWRAFKAMDLGFEPAIDTSFDIIFHTTASANGLQFSIDHLAHEGRVIELSWYGNKKVNLALGYDFHYKRLQIISSQVSVIPGHMPNESYKSRKDLALSYLKDESYDQLITNRVPFNDTPNFYENLRKGKQPKGIIYIIDY